MDFIKSFFKESVRLLNSRKYHVGLDEIDGIEYHQTQGIIALLSNGNIYLLTNDTCQLFMELGTMHVERMLFVESKLWIWGEKLNIYDLQTLSNSAVDEILIKDWNVWDNYKALVFVGTVNGNVMIFDVNACVLASLQAGSLPVLDIKGNGEIIAVAQESVISCWDMKTFAKLREFSVNQCLTVALSLDNDKIASLSLESIAVHRLKESWIPKKQISFNVSLKGTRQAIWHESVLIVIGCEKMSAYHFKKEVEFVASVDVDVFGKVYYKCIDEELHFLVPQKSCISVYVLSKDTWRKIDCNVPDFDFANSARNSFKVFSNSSQFLIGEMNVVKKDFCSFLSRNIFFTAEKRTSWDLLALMKEHICEIWDPWAKQMVYRIDVTSFFGRTRIDNIIFAQKSIVFLGGPRLLLYKFISSVDIKLSKQREEELNRLMCSLDDVVDSVIGQAMNPSENDGIEIKSEESDALNEAGLTEEKNVQEIILDDNASFDIIGNMMVKAYNNDSSSEAQWTAAISIINDNVIKNVIVDVDSDLIAIQADDCEVKIGRMSNIGNFVLQKIEGNQPIKLLNFAMFCLRDNLLPCIICITTKGAVSVIMLSMKDDTDINILSFGNDILLILVNIQKGISQSPVATYTIDESGNLQKFNNPKHSPDHYLICIFSLSIRIFLFQSDYSHRLFQDIAIDSKDGMIIRSGVFSRSSRLFLGVVHLSGLLKVFSIPDLSIVFREKIICDIHQSEEKESKSQIYDGSKSSNPRQVLKGFVNKANADEGNIQPTINSELQQKMNQRGEALQNLETKFADLSSGTSDFVKKIKEYNDKQAKKKWWQL